MIGADKRLMRQRMTRDPIIDLKLILIMRLLLGGIVKREDLEAVKTPFD